MGCYMSTPDKRVFVSDGEGKNFIYATASCQGWRRDQEDAEECIPYFDDNASLFILCDGHGGAEVAKYTVEHLPNFIKNHPLYKEGKYEEALERAFIEFDALLRTDEVYKELERLANEETPKKKKKDSQTLDGEPSGSAGTSSSPNDNGTMDDDIDADTLRREAQLPLSSILEKYPAILALAEQSRASRVTASPVIRAPRDDENGDGSLQPKPSSSTSNEQEPTQGPSNLNTPVKSGGLMDSATSKPLVTTWPAEDSNDDSESDSGSDFFFKGGSSSDDDENDDGDDEGDNEAGEGTSSGPKKIRRKKHKRPLDDDSDTSSTDEDDDDDDDDLDSGSEVDGSGEDEDEEIDDEDVDQESAGDEEEDEQWEDLPEASRANRAHKPGMDSGCTVVVALVKDGKIYVASAGDSRCILVMRDGECKPMSFDHKPEDPIERKRIAKAGGRVTEGRVNGGLNLSRALGDFTYKNPELDAKDQMITACPDINSADLNPEEVEYIFLACDGIWNSMKNQQAAKFIRKAAPNSKQDLVQLCVQLFRNCIAPQTDGDGTGCDNMTCIIAKYNSSLPHVSTTNDLKKEVTEEHEAGAKKENEAEPSLKRSTSDDDETNDLPTKRRCLRL